MCCCKTIIREECKDLCELNDGYDTGFIAPSDGTYTVRFCVNCNACIKHEITLLSGEPIIVPVLLWIDTSYMVSVDGVTPQGECIKLNVKYCNLQFKPEPQPTETNVLGC